MIQNTPQSSNRVRTWSAVVFAGCVGVLVFAAGLEPDPSGKGTHMQAGLHECPSIAAGKGPCITCGMTTSVALAADGRVLDSIKTQPAAGLLALALASGVWISGYTLWTGTPRVRELRRLLCPATFVVVAAVLMAAWAYKIMAGSTGSLR